MRSIKSGSDYIYTTAFKTDTNTAGTGLTPALTMYKLSDSSVIINAQNMTEVSNGLYKYTIPTASLVTGNSYAVYVDGGATLTTFRYQYDAIDVDVSLAGQGNGGISQPLLIKDVNGDGAENAKVEVYSSPSMSTATKLSGNLFTDDVGQITINLNAGTYYLRVTNRGQTFASPITITVAA